MKDLILPENNSMEENILAIIEFIKQVEREHGLSEDEIVYKYTCAYCSFMAETVFTALKVLFGDIQNIDYINIPISNNVVDHHSYLTLTKTKNEIYYFDILGKKTKNEVDKFLQSDFWKNIFTKSWDDFESSSKYNDWKYVYDTCKQHIKPSELTTKTHIDLC